MDERPPSLPGRRRLEVKLWMMLVALVVLAVPLAWWVEKARARQRAVAMVRK
jgi:hypothetical protein